jgi:predicted Zn-dependent protease
MQGVFGARKEGLQELRLTAAHGRYLAPLARILLAVAYLGNKDIQQAKQLLSALAREFPDNPLFPAAIARLEPHAR